MTQTFSEWLRTRNAKLLLGFGAGLAMFFWFLLGTDIATTVELTNERMIMATVSILTSLLLVIFVKTNELSLDILGKTFFAGTAVIWCLLIFVWMDASVRIAVSLSVFALILILMCYYGILIEVLNPDRD